MKELQKQTGVRIKVVAGDENTENKEAVILIEESFASGQVGGSVRFGWVALQQWEPTMILFVS